MHAAPSWGNALGRLLHNGAPDRAMLAAMALGLGRIATALLALGSPALGLSRTATAPLALASLALGLAGCLAMPVAIPPMIVSVSPAVALGKTLPASAGPGQPKARIMLEGRAAIQPLAAVQGWDQRTFDFSLGYLTEVIPDASLLEYTRHGGFLGLTAYPYSSGLSDGSWASRVGITAMPELFVMQNDATLGGGMTFNLSLETFDYVSTDIAELNLDGGLIGGALGEGGFGIDVGAGVRGIGEMRYWTAHLGLRMRLPAAGGLLFLPIWALLDKN